MTYRPLLLSVLCFGARALSQSAAPGTQVTDQLAKLPLAFERNQGQAPHAVDFLAHGAGYSVSLSKATARIALRHEKQIAPVTVELRLAGARLEPTASARQPLPGRVNYFLGNDPAHWRTNIATYQRVEYSNVYPGVDLAYYGNQGRLEYDFVVAPEADPNAIRLIVDGAQEVTVDGNGDLVLETGKGAVRFRKPSTYQESAGARHEIESRYVLTGAHEVRFALGAYDRQRALVIDPSLVYSTYLGGSSYDYGTAVAVDPNGNTFIAGFTESLDFPVVDPEQSFFTGYSAIVVSKLAPGGSSLVYATYFAGSTYDLAYSIAVDSSDSAYITGITESSDFPVKNPIYPTLNGPEDAFITKFSPAGDALVYSTYLGGSSYDYAYGVAVDSSDAAYLTGQTYSMDFPVTAGAYQTSYDGSCGFVTKVDPKGAALAWSTYFGQNCAALPAAIAVDSKDSPYITGSTIGGLPVTPNAAQPVFGGEDDAFIAKFSKTGAALAYATYLGGSQADYATSIAVDAGGNAYVTGSTASTNLPVTSSAIQPALAGGYDAFVAKLNGGGTAWTYVTYLGGTRDDNPTGIAVDSSGNALVTGTTISADFPQTSAVQPSLAGNANLLYKTTSTGSSWSASDTGLPDITFSIAIDPASDKHLLAGTESGLFQSTDSGSHWIVVSPFAGLFVAGIAFSPGGGPVYAAAFGAVYSSADDGATWTLAGNAPCGVATIVVDPAAPTTLYITNGTSFLYFYPGCAAKSTDGGANWTTLSGLTFNYAVLGLSLNPKSPAVLYAATDSGLFKSINAGRTWTTLNISGFVNPYVYGVVVDPTQPSTVYAIVYGNLYKSTDAGSTFTQLPNAPTGVDNLALAPSKTSDLYAATYLGVYFSSNAGGSWSPAGLSGDDIVVVAVDPSKPAVAYASSPVANDAFVAKVNTTGSKLTYSTYLGGTGDEFAYGIAVTAGGNAVVTGQTEGYDFPSTAGAFQAADGSFRETAFVTEIGGPTPACTYTASPGSYLFYPYGGALDLSVVAPSGCAWTPAPSEPWITVTRGSGPGVAPLAISVASNTGIERAGKIAIGTGSVDIVQAAGNCFYELSTFEPSFPQAGGPVQIMVTAGTGCAWNVTGLPLWLTVTSGGSGKGNGTVTLAAAPNPFPGTRSGYPVIAGSEVYATEAGTSGAAMQPARPPAPHAPRCVPAGAACPAAAVTLRVKQP